jgi:serine/threonine protein kinase/tetratricopeptide (TPR) repeat protein
MPEFPLPQASMAVYGQSGTPPSGEANRRHLSPGTELSGRRYKIEKLMAVGDMDAVYRAMDLRFSRLCAIKEVLDDFQSEVERGQAVEWFKREATLLLDLNHPCLPRVRDFFLEAGHHYLVMDFIDGRTLGDVLERDGNVPGIGGARGVSEARVRSWALQICSALSYLHRQSPPIIFRDLKPSNIMVTECDEIKLIDFGIARTFQSQRQSTIIMTIGYAPPEQLHGMPEPRSDIYALGATLHRVLTHHDAANNKPSIFSFPPVRTLRPDISIAFEQVIMKALTPTLEQRWSSAAEMERAVNNLPPITAQSLAAPTVLAPGGERPAPQASPALAPGGERPAPQASPALPSSSSLTGPAGDFIRAAQDHLNASRIERAQPRSLAQEHLQFTAFHPRVVSTGTWNTLLVYAYIESALQAIRTDAARFKEELGSMSSEVDVWALRPLTRGIQIVVIPTFKGVTFNPEWIGFTWVEDWHSARFRFQADNRLAGATESGEVAIYAGPLLVAALKLSLRFVEQSLQPLVVESRNQGQVSASPYRKIFTSYSHADTPVVQAIRNVYKALGDESFIDIEHLRSGQDWNAALMRLIDAADIFQLFWSDHASQSRYVEQEWQYAFQHSRGESFIRPIYWKKPMRPPPAELSHLHFQYIELPAETFSPVTKGPAAEALTHLNAGRIEQAYQAVQQAYVLEPNNSLVHRIFGQVFALRKPPDSGRAIQAYNHSLLLNPNDAETHKLLGDVWLFLRRLPQQAVPAYIQSLRLRTDDYEAHQRLAQCYEGTNQLELALHEYQEAARLAPQVAAVQFSLGQLAMRLNHFTVAERAFVQLLTINPADHSTRFLLSEVYEHEGKLEAAWRECTYIVRAMPGNQAALALLQRLRSQLG